MGNVIVLGETMANFSKNLIAIKEGIKGRLTMLNAISGHKRHFGNPNENT